MSSILRTILDGFPARRVLVLGDLMLDEYLTGDCSRISPEAPVPVLAVSQTRAVLGGAANTANNIASLGGQVTLVGLLGEDEAGQRIQDVATQAGIQLQPVWHRAPTVRKVRVLGQQQQLLRLDYDAPQTADDGADDRVLAQVAAHLDGCAAVVISDYAKGVVTARLCQAVIAAARARGIPIVVDPRPQNASCYAGCDFITPNWKEALGLLGLPDRPMTRAGLLEVGQEISARFGSHALLTLGAKGMMLFGHAGQLLVERAALAREVFDVSGAGDTVVAMFTLAMVSGCDLAEAVELANRAAGLVVAKLGTATVTPAELLRDAGPERALVQRSELRGLADRLRAQGLRIVTMNGSFDIMHAGHVYFLREARKHGNVLIVGLNSDESVRGNKGPDRPFIRQDDRAKMLLALRDVDYVHIFDEEAPMAFLDAVRPDVHVNGAEYGENCVEAETVRRNGGRLQLIDRLPGLSTSELVQRVQLATGVGRGLAG